ncbi:MAG: hypothetical protein WBN77_16050 [Desulfobacterales bacterium]
MMRKLGIEYDSRIDDLVAISKRLSSYEGRYKMQSEEFFDRFAKGLTEDSEEFIEWANDYQHFIALREDVEPDFVMPVFDPLLKYLDAVESAFNGLGTGYFERYEEKIFKSERADLRIRVRFLNGSPLACIWSFLYYRYMKELFCWMRYRNIYQDLVFI